MKTREQWLEEAVLQVQPLFDPVAGEFDTEFPKVRVSVGWPSKGGTSAKNQVIGQCWKTSVSTDGVSQIFISPTQDDVIQILGVLIHELIHAWDDCESGHKGRFAKVARAVGLEGKLTATDVREDSELGEVLTRIAQGLGDFPHAKLDLNKMKEQRKPQTTRMLKLAAPDCCGFLVRTTAKWLDSEGFPQCPHGVTMERD